MRQLSEAEAAKKIEEMVRRIVERFDPERIILFGSRARGAARADSDVDLLVVLAENGAKRRTTVEIYRLLAGMGIPKDIVVASLEEIEKYRDVAGTLIRPAVREGRVLYERFA